MSKMKEERKDIWAVLGQAFQMAWKLPEALGYHLCLSQGIQIILFISTHTNHSKKKHP